MGRLGERGGIGGGPLQEEGEEDGEGEGEEEEREEEEEEEGIWEGKSASSISISKWEGSSPLPSLPLPPFPPLPSLPIPPFPPPPPPRGVRVRELERKGEGAEGLFKEVEEGTKEGILVEVVWLMRGGVPGLRILEREGGGGRGNGEGVEKEGCWS